MSLTLQPTLYPRKDPAVKTVQNLASKHGTPPLSTVNKITLRGETSSTIVGVKRDPPEKEPTVENLTPPKKESSVPTVQNLTLSDWNAHCLLYRN